MEIDFVIELGPEIAAIEVKSGKNREAPSINKIDRFHHVDRRIMFYKGNITEENGIDVSAVRSLVHQGNGEGVGRPGSAIRSHHVNGRGLPRNRPPEPGPRMPYDECAAHPLVRRDLRKELHQPSMILIVDHHDPMRVEPS